MTSQSDAGGGPSSNQEPTSSSTLEQISILHVDDEPDFAELVATFLQRGNDHFDVQTATSVDDALTEMEGAAFDCIVSDYDMPGRNGLEFLEVVRESDPELPFILYTGKGSESVASDAISAGVTDYLQKKTGTSQYDLLANRIENAVEQYRSKRRAAQLERSRRISSDINQALVTATSMDEIESAVCTVLADTDGYGLAWIGDVDPESGEIDPRTVAGDGRDLLADLSEAGDGGEDATGVYRSAVRDRDPIVATAPRGDPVSADLDAAATERGFRAALVVPLAYEDDFYGVLAVYATRNDVFDDAERDLFSNLADNVAQALHAKDVKQALRRSKDRFRALFENAPGPVIAGEIEADGDQHVIRAVNDAFVDAFGYEGEEVVGRDVAEVVVPETGWDRHQEFRRKAAAGEPVEAEVERKTAQGAKEFLLDVIPYGATDGQAAGWYAWFTDITDRTQREAQISHQRSLFEALLETSIDGILVVDENREYVTWNQRFIDMWGVPDELLAAEKEDPGLEWALGQLEDPEEFIEQVEYLYEHPSEESRDEIRLNDGRVFDRYSAPVEDEEGRHYGRVWFFRDITERKARFRELERERNRFQAVFETVPEPVVHVVFEGTDPIVEQVNDAFEEVFGYGSEAVRGRSLDELIVSDDQADDASDINRAVQETGLYQTELRRQTVDGENPFLFTARTMDLGHEDTERVEGVGTYVDLSDQKRRERELARQNDRLDEFASVLSHDLRNPLNVAEGRLDLAQAEVDNKHLDEIDGALQRMETLIEDMLELAREGEQVREVETVELGSLAEACWENVRTADASLETPAEQTIEADRSRLQQLLENLFRNAVEHAGPGVTITVGDLPGGGFFVEDDGTGIPEDRHEEVFEVGVSEFPEGTGVGLSIVRQIAEAHGWEVTLGESGSGGARFEFRPVSSL